MKHRPKSVHCIHLCSVVLFFNFYLIIKGQQSDSASSTAASHLALGFEPPFAVHFRFTFLSIVQIDVQLSIRELGQQLGSRAMLKGPRTLTLLGMGFEVHHLDMGRDSNHTTLPDFTPGIPSRVHFCSVLPSRGFQFIQVYGNTATMPPCHRVILDKANTGHRVMGGDFWLPSLHLKALPQCWAQQHFLPPLKPGIGLGSPGFGALYWPQAVTILGGPKMTIWVGPQKQQTW